MKILVYHNVVVIFIYTLLCKDIVKSNNVKKIYWKDEKILIIFKF